MYDAAPIDEYIEFAQPALDGLNASVGFLPQLGRHTGSHAPFDRSNRTVVNRHVSHGWAPLILQGSHPDLLQRVLSLP